MIKTKVEQLAYQVQYDTKKIETYKNIIEQTKNDMWMNADRKREVIRSLTKDLEETERTLAKIQVEHAVEVIRPYFEREGSELSFDVNPYVDKITFSGARKGDIIYLVINKVHEKGAGVKEYKTGFIVFKPDGTVLIDFSHCDSVVRGTSSKEIVTYETLPSDNIIFDENNIITTAIRFSGPYIHYRNIDGKFVPVHEFSKEDFKHGNNSPDIKRLNVEGDKILISCRGKLYSVTDACYLNDLEFETTFAHGLRDSSDAFYPGWLYTDPEEYQKSTNDSMKEVASKNNLLVGYHRIDVLEENRREDTETFVFLDYTGKIVSKMFYELDGALCSMDVSNETYYDALKEVERILIKRIYDQIRKEKEAEVAKTKAAMEKRKQIMTQLPLIEITKDSEETEIGSEPMKYTYKPKEVKETISNGN